MSVPLRDGAGAARASETGAETALPSGRGASAACHPSVPPSAQPSVHAACRGRKFHSLGDRTWGQKERDELGLQDPEAATSYVGRPSPPHSTGVTTRRGRARYPGARALGPPCQAGRGPQGQDTASSTEVLSARVGPEAPSLRRTLLRDPTRTWASACRSRKGRRGAVRWSWAGDGARGATHRGELRARRRAGRGPAAAAAAGASVAGTCRADAAW